MKLYCLDIIVIGFVVLVTSGIVIDGAIENNMNTQREYILNEGYIETPYTYDQLSYSNYEECIEYNNTFYCR